MDADTAQARVREEVIDHLRAAAAHAPGYIERYVGAAVVGRRPPSVPTHMHPLMARMIRDLTWDVLTAERLARPRVEVS